MVCTRCDGDLYGLGGGKCHQCPKSADCTGSEDGFDIVARAGGLFSRMSLGRGCRGSVSEGFDVRVLERPTVLQVMH